MNIKFLILRWIYFNRHFLKLGFIYVFQGMRHYIDNYDIEQACLRHKNCQSLVLSYFTDLVFSGLQLLFCLWSKTTPNLVIPIFIENDELEKDRFPLFCALMNIRLTWSCLFH